MIGRGRSLLLALALLAAGSGAEAQEFRYCAFGDSITCGKYDSGGPCDPNIEPPLHPTAGYPARLRQAGRLNCPVDGSGGCMVYNYGKPGERTPAGLTRLDDVLAQRRFDVLLLMEGTNDIWNNVSNNTIRTNLQAMEIKAKAKGVDTVFASIIRIHPQSAKAHKNPQVQALKDDLASIAANRGRWFANPWQVLCPGSSCFNQHYAFGGPLGETSGLHPDASGYDILANSFQAAIQQAPVPATPSPQAPADGAVTDSSKVSWTKSGHATWYQLWWNGGAGRRWVDGRAVCSGTTCSWTIPGLATGTTHTWRVRARNPRGRSGWSATRSFSLVSSLPGIELTWTPGRLGFGVVEVGDDSGPKSATLENTGELSLSGLSFDRTGSGAFATQTGGCPGTLAPGASCSINATFTPSAAGWAGGRLVVSSNQGITAELDLAGRGVAAGAGLKPVRLEVQPAGNGVFEPGEQVTVAPGWRNDEPAARSLQGTADDYGGPAGATYTLLPPPDADYGSIEPGKIRSCRATGICYRMAVTNPASRPAVHWDATFQETPSSGAAKTWSLHIGDSFADVPRAHLFYPAVEGIFHHGVTTGCGGGQFCPEGGVSRAQMAVFLLRAAEGEDYTPPACTPGNTRFNDVPADHPFCRWIEELADRGITTGCGGGNYCPSAPVTRDAMAVFLLRTRSGSAYDAPSCKGLFADVACPSPFADWIEELYDRGIAAGCGTNPRRYCPAQPVTRAQMASFLVRTFRLTAYGP